MPHHNTRNSHTRLRAWWRDSGILFFSKQLARVIAGCVAGSVTAGFLHLLLFDSHFVAARKSWCSNSVFVKFDGFSSYKFELGTLFIAVAIVFTTTAARHASRFLRAWWVGITSLTFCVSAVATVTSLELGTHQFRNLAALLGASTFAMFGLELWRQGSFARGRKASDEALQLQVPEQGRTKALPEEWVVSTSDDPIHDWDEDLIGRASVVQILAEHALVTQTPIVALHGGFGDGKTSTLNLLRSALQDKAIVVSFSAWLPDSEKTLAADLFRDIATECRKHFSVPQLRKRTLAYARMVSGSVSFLGGVKELLPFESQREEVEELRSAFARIPKRIVVLIDEVDRMQRDELLVLFKILRGAATIPNVTFICAFSERDVRKELGNDSHEYLEKFFPVTVRLSSPDPKFLGTIVKAKLRDLFGHENWIQEKNFEHYLDDVWEDGISHFCTNLRKSALLLNDITTAAKPIAGEVNPLDLSVVETIRRFYPELYEHLRRNQYFLTYESGSWSKLRSNDETKAEAKSFFTQLNTRIAETQDAKALRELLYWVFPNFAAASNSGISRHSLNRPTNEDIAERDKRICDSDYFGIYFRAAIPDEMFSNAELSLVIAELNHARDEEVVRKIYLRWLKKIPNGSPKRSDFLWKLGRAVLRIKDDVTEMLAFTAAACATEYTYEIMNLGEAARALNIVFEAAQKFSTSDRAQNVLTGAMLRASDDTFALRLLEYTSLERNKVLIDYSHVDSAGLKEAFIRRMRLRYGRDTTSEDISTADWWAFGKWARNSETDREIEQAFWRRFVGTSRKKLAQAINFIFPGNIGWQGDPKDAINDLWPASEIMDLLSKLPDHERLNDRETAAIRRFKDLMNGTFAGFQYR